MTRRIHRLLIRLHPRDFRDCFGDEMELIFEEGARSWGEAALLCDAAGSLLRRWFLRPAIWKWIAASIGATVPLILSFGSFLPWSNFWTALRAYF
ncbi:MAG TPA: hypothetical protein VKP58_04110 [Candidatus Acidoferrum sp.]|nr:hypothetical protein [Candidatus Acidoferrum sp.]